MAHTSVPTATDLLEIKQVNKDCYHVWFGGMLIRTCASEKIAQANCKTFIAIIERLRSAENSQETNTKKAAGRTDE